MEDGETGRAHGGLCSLTQRLFFCGSPRAIAESSSSILELLSLLKDRRQMFPSSKELLVALQCM